MAHDRLAKDRFRHFGNFLMRFDKHRSAYRILTNQDYEFSISNNRFVASYALIKACDIHAQVPQSSHIDYAYLAEMNDRISQYPEQSRALSIYVCTNALTEFVKQVLPKIDRPFILLSGDSDMPVNKDALGSTIEQICEHSKLALWFAQNKDCEHPKLRALPIGLDLHSKWIEPTIWGGGLILPTLQELEIKQILSKSKQWNARKSVAYCDWVMALDRGDRQECKDAIDPKLCIYPGNALPRSQSWTNQAECAFVISPSGAGTDCHRTWEALTLGCVPIVKKSGISDLFTDLPVIVVKDWHEVTTAFLQAKHQEMERQSFDFSKLLMSYWKRQIMGVQADSESLPRMSMAQFRQMLTA